MRQCLRTRATIFVSPRSGRAVSRAAGDPYRHKLLALPVGLGQPGRSLTAAEIEQGLALTGYFLAKHAYGGTAGGPPAARARLVSLLAGADRAAAPGGKA